MALAVAAVLGAGGLWISRQRDATLAGMRERGTWRVGIDPSFPPFEMADAQTGQASGLDVDLAHAIAGRMGVQAELVGVGFDELVDAVAAHRVDSAISALPMFPERTQEVAFSSPYVEAGTVLAVPITGSITGPADLSGRRVAVEWGSEGDAQARQFLESDGELFGLVLRETPAAALEAVTAGEADAAIIDAISLALFDREGDLLRVAGPPLRGDPYVVVLPVDAPRLRAAVNHALAELEADGTLPDLRRRWLGPAADPAPSQTPAAP